MGKKNMHRFAAFWALCLALAASYGCSMDPTPPPRDEVPSMTFIGPSTQHAGTQRHQSYTVVGGAARTRCTGGAAQFEGGMIAAISTALDCSTVALIKNNNELAAHGVN